MLQAENINEGLIDALENIQLHTNEKVAQMASEIIREYFGGEEEIQETSDHKEYEKPQIYDF